MENICAVDDELSDTQQWLVQPNVERDERRERRRDWYVDRPRRLPSVLYGNAASRFDALRDAWHREYGSSSSTTKITSTASYRSIIEMGDAALPFIFRDLERHRYDPDNWFVALFEITKANPVSPADRGNRPAMAKAWLKWARDAGHAW
jgi:hypothetical protein